MLTAEMTSLISTHTAGMVATTRDDGTAAVSPKATFVVMDDSHIAFGNIRSPGTLANLRKRPKTEVCFIDVLTRKAVRVSGNARIIAKTDADAKRFIAAFNDPWGTYLDIISAFVDIEITAAELILSPAYDIGLSEAELKATNLAKLQAL